MRFKNGAHAGRRNAGIQDVVSHFFEMRANLGEIASNGHMDFMFVISRECPGDEESRIVRKRWPPVPPRQT